MAINWTGQRQKAEQMQTYLDIWFAELDKRKPVYKNRSKQEIKQIYQTDFDPIFVQAYDTYKKLDNMFNRLKDILNDDT